MGGFIATDDDEAVGIVHWITHRSCWTIGDYCYLQDLFVAPGRRGGGIGRKLIETVYDKARALGCSRVYWLTHETNAARCGSMTASPIAPASCNIERSSSARCAS